MYVIYIDDEVYAEVKSPVQARLKESALRRRGYNAYVVFDEGSICNV